MMESTISVFMSWQLLSTSTADRSVDPSPQYFTYLQAYLFLHFLPISGLCTNLGYCDLPIYAKCCRGGILATDKTKSSAVREEWASFSPLLIHISLVVPCILGSPSRLGLGLPKIPTPVLFYVCIILS